MYAARQNKEALRRIIESTGNIERKRMNTKNTLLQCLRYDIHTGGFPFEYVIDSNELGRGTKTNPVTRNHVNNNMIAPNNFNLVYVTYTNKADALNDVGHIYRSPILQVQNPVIPGTRWDAGHALARQNGGLGDIVNHVFPQNKIINRGWNGTYNNWKFYEQDFHNKVFRDGFGRWHIY